MMENKRTYVALFRTVVEGQWEIRIPNVVGTGIAVSSNHKDIEH
jgi:hypothetical protein